MTLITCAIFLVTVATESSAPWWAGSAERVLTAWGQAAIVALIPLGGTVVRGLISHREHKATSAAVAEIRKTQINGTRADA